MKEINNFFLLIILLSLIFKCISTCGTGCELCDGVNNICVYCQFGYYLPSSSSSFCEKCNSNCNTCKGSSTYC